MKNPILGRWHLYIEEIFQPKWDNNNNQPAFISWPYATAIDQPIIDDKALLTTWWNPHQLPANGLRENWSFSNSISLPCTLYFLQKVTWFACKQKYIDFVSCLHHNSLVWCILPVIYRVPCAMSAELRVVTLQGHFWKQCIILIISGLGSLSQCLHSMLLPEFLEHFDHQLPIMFIFNSCCFSWSVVTPVKHDVIQRFNWS